MSELRGSDFAHFIENERKKWVTLEVKEDGLPYKDDDNDEQVVFEDDDEEGVKQALKEQEEETSIKRRFFGNSITKGLYEYLENLKDQDERVKILRIPEDIRINTTHSNKLYIELYDIPPHFIGIIRELCIKCLTTLNIPNSSIIISNGDEKEILEYNIKLPVQPKVRYVNELIGGIQILEEPLIID